MQDTEENRERFRRYIEGLAAAWNQRLSVPQIYAYWLGLQDLKLAQVRDGVTTAIREGGEFMPPPGILRRFCGASPRSQVPYHQPWKGHKHEQLPPTFERMLGLLKPKPPEEPS